MNIATRMLLTLLLTPCSIFAQEDPPAPYPQATYPDASSPNPGAAAVNNDYHPLPFYPSPWGTGTGAWAPAYEKARDFVSQLSLTEKVNLTTGVGWEGERCVGQNGAIPRLGFRSMCMQDSPVGVRNTDYSSVFPAGVNVAASWDRGLAYARGAAMGAEHRDKGSDVLLGPVAGPLGRSPQGGRNWEGFSPDPVLTGVMMAESVQGIQSSQVIACVKHLIGNEQEHFRQATEAQGYGFKIDEAVSSNIDDQTMHELYLWPFADAIRAGAASFMCSYNQVNNSYACQNSYLLNGLLKSELGFQGFVMSDWQAQHSGVSTALSGLDMTMPGDTLFNSGKSYWGTNLTIAVLNGTVPQWRLDDMCTRIIAAWFYVGRDSASVPINFDSWTTDTFGYENYFAKEGYTQINSHVDVRAEHNQLIRQLGAASTVLLKNTDKVLPLTGREKFTAVFGSDAGSNMYGPNGCPDRGCDNGTLGMAWGSGSANFPYLVTPESAIQYEVLSRNGVFQSITDDYATMQIQALAGQASIAIVFVNADSGEGFINVDGNEGDRNNLTLWKGGDALIHGVSALCNNTIVVIHSTGPILLGDYADHPNITAILWAGVPGQESGNAITDVLYGRVNPGAKLPFTMGRSRKDYGTDLLYKPNNGGLAPQVNFTEGVFIDYRSFDHANIVPVYEFGYGLSYTSFQYSALQISKTGGPQTDAEVRTTGLTSPAPIGNDSSASDTSAPYQYPLNFTPVSSYIYPYLDSLDLAKSSSSTGYGDNSFVPPDAHNSSAQPLLPASGIYGGNPQLYDVLYEVTATITNTGAIPGEEVVQLYISLGGDDNPKIVLRNFQRLSIQPGQSATFRADITRRDISNWNVVSQNWVIADFSKTVYVGSSSRKLPLSGILP